jgi:hypothetical protein
MTTQSRAEDLSIVFAACLDELLAGSPMDVCLRRSGAHRQEIRPLLMAVQAARLADAVPSLSPDKALRLKTEFLAAAFWRVADGGPPERGISQHGLPSRGGRSLLAADGEKHTDGTTR